MRRLNMRKNENPGFLITFCGLDGCGKTTMMKRLIAELEKEHNLFLTKHIGKTVHCLLGMMAQKMVLLIF